MHVMEVVGYDVMFGGESPNPLHLLAGIPSKYVIGLLGTLSNTLERKGNTIQTQLELFDAISINFPQKVKYDILNRLVVYERRRGAFTIFENRYIVEMIQREYLHFRTEESPEFTAPPGVAELNIFMAYALVIDETVEIDNSRLNEAIEASRVDPEFGLYRVMWPYFAKQFEFTAKVDNMYEGFKGLALLNFLSRSSRYAVDSANFYERFAKKDAKDYLGRLFGIIRDNLKSKDNGSPDDFFIRFRLGWDDPLIQHLTVDPAIIASDEKKQQDYIGMKEKPIFQYTPNEYVIPYWNYVYLCLYPGLLFTFHRKSGLAVREDFPEFKKNIGLHFSEHFLFRRLMDQSFGKSIVRYYEEDDFNPDCFMRQGRDIFIIEFKDNLVAADIIQSLSYEKFKGAIDKAFIESENKSGTKVKGISQLARLIERLLQKCDDIIVSEDILPAGLNFSQMKVYPIIVYTNFYFDMPGVNDYLDKEFKKRFPNLQQDNIKPITIINLHYFYERFLAFSDGMLQLKREIEAYRSLSDDRKQKARRTGETEDQMVAEVGFKEWADSCSNSYLNHRRDEIIQETMKLWDIE